MSGASAWACGRACTWPSVLTRACEQKRIGRAWCTVRVHSLSITVNHPTGTCQSMGQVSLRALHAVHILRCRHCTCTSIAAAHQSLRTNRCCAQHHRSHLRRVQGVIQGFVHTGQLHQRLHHGYLALLLPNALPACAAQQPPLREVSA